jgi:RimJ/RimL family protein N-acetyltransferase
VSESPTLRGPRITLRPVRLDDAAGLFDLVCDPAVTKYLSWASPSRVEETRENLERTLAEQEAPGANVRHFTIALTADGRPIGRTSLKHLDLDNRRATVGSWIGRPFWGQGFMRETKALILCQAFESLGLERLQAWVDIDNQRSLSSLERCGFRREGIARRHRRRGDAFVSQVLMAILRGEHTPLARAVLNGAP